MFDSKVILLITTKTNDMAKHMHMFYMPDTEKEYVAIFRRVI